MSKERWSIPTWMLFHGLAEKIDEDYYKQNNKKVFDIINTICQNLPCPFCRVNATKYLNINMLKAYKWFEEKFYGNYIVQHDFNKWRRNIVKEKVKDFFGGNWRKMFK